MNKNTLLGFFAAVAIKIEILLNIVWIAAIFLCLLCSCSAFKRLKCTSSFARSASAFANAIA